MGRDLWSFKSVKELERQTKDMPDTILKEQIMLLGEKTEFTLYGKPVFMKVHNNAIDYSIATMFDVVVPALDNYEKTILIMYSNPETEYPVAITLGNSFEDDCELFKPDYVCKNKEEFEKTIKEILASDRILNMIQMLFSKASMIEN